MEVSSCFERQGETEVWKARETERERELSLIELGRLSEKVSIWADWDKREPEQARETKWAEDVSKLEIAGRD